MTQVWRGWCGSLGIAALAMGWATIASGGDAKAQVIPDATLGSENSTVTSTGSVDQLTGGATRGANLFHSFEQFSITPGSTASFNNALAIQNIFSRVTGPSSSSIDGLIQATGTATLFLLNPNGIVFGPNARLDIGGSFLASTASSLNFADGTSFSATAPQATPLLTVSVPVGLQLGPTAAGIQVQGPGAVRNGNGLLLNRDAGLQVQPDETLALVGGDILLQGGILTTDGGRIELGSVAGPSLVSLSPIAKGWSLSYKGAQNFGNIRLSNAAAVDASGTGGGDIQVRGRRVALTEGSQIEASTLGAERGGNLSVTASESVELIGYSVLSTGVSLEATGKGGNITVETGRLLLRDGAAVSAGTFGDGAAGNLTVKASESVELSNSFIDTSAADTLAGATGKGGNITVETGRLVLRNEAQIAAGTFGEGAAGNLTVKASESVELSGAPTGLRTVGYSLSTGKGGNITVETGRLVLQDGAQVDASTFGEGAAGNLTVKASESVELTGSDATSLLASGLFTSAETFSTGKGGNVTVETGRLILQDGAQVSAGTRGEGAAGNLTVKASESVELTGTDATGRPSTLTALTEGTGAAGDLTIATGQLTVRDRAEVSVSSTSTGNAGNLQVTASSVQLDSQGQLTTTSASGSGGNIILRPVGDLRLRRNSDINTNAGGTGIGGNITINSDTLVALEDSDITADASEGPGGRVQINTQGDIRSLDSNITASSELGINGVVEINTPDIDLQGSLTQLTANFVSPDQVVAGSCLAQRNTEQGSFTVTGTGGLPRSPYEGISGYYSVTGVQPIQGSAPASKGAEVVKTASWKRGDPIQEAQGLFVTADGRTIVGTAPQLATIAKAQDLVCSG